MVSSTNILKKDAFPKDIPNNLHSVMKSRENVVALKTLNPNSTDSFNNFEEKNLPAPNEKFSFELISERNEEDLDNKVKQSLLKRNRKSRYKESKKISDPKEYSLLSPTIGDFLIDLNKKNNENTKDLSKTTIPEASLDMKSLSWADEAGFTYIDIAEYNREEIDTLKPNPIPVPDTIIAKFTDEVKQLLYPRR